jgi:hypothetical protein
VTPQIKVLKNHGQSCAQQTQLIFVRNLELAVFVTNQTNVLPTDDNGTGARFFKKVNAAQKGTFTGA